jgi:hypothetical protein
MKKHILLAIGLLASLLTAQAQYFYPSNLVVVQQTITNPSTGLASTGLGITLVELQTNGTQVNTSALPSSGANSFILGTSTTEGFVTLSANSNFLVLAGYNAQPGTSPAGATSTNAHRAVATVDAYNNYALPISNPNIYSTYNCRGAVSDGLGNFWTSGSGGTGANIANGEIGIVYVGTAATSPVNYCVTETGTGNERCLEIYNGYLYLSTGSSSHGIFIISNVSGTYPEATVSPASANAGSSAIIPMNSSSGPYAFQMNAGGTVLYVAEDNLGGIEKWTGTGPGPTGVWTSNYTLPVITAGAAAAFTNAYGCAVDWSQTPPVIYATTSETVNNRLVRIVDTGAGATATLIATAPTDTAFRGVRFGPQLYAYISVPPVAFAGNPGDTATFSATVLGSPTPTLQWYSNSVANPAWVAISGATTATLTLHNITQAQGGSLFYLQAVNTYGTSTNTPVSLTVQNPAIQTDPVGATNLPGGGPVNVCVSAIGTGTLTYQWFSNNVAISGANAACYSVPSSSTPVTASYTVIVTNTSGAIKTTATSTAAVVAYTPLLLSDTFTYPNGNLFGDAGSPWTDINGTNPELVTNGRVQVSQLNFTTDAQSMFFTPESSTVMWASFIINLTTLPTNAGGVYFANFEDTNFGFYGRIFTLTSNAASLTPGIPNVAFPGTYRLGIADGQGDSTGTSSTGPNAVVPLDLAPGIDYQVVYYLDLNADVSGMAVNPASVSDVTANSPGGVSSGVAEDTINPANAMAAFGLRQRQGEGIMQLDNLEVSFDWNGAGSGYAAVTGGITAAAPVIGFQPVGITNFSGNPFVMEVAASGIGAPGTGLTYAWYQNSGPLSDGADGGTISGSQTPTLTISSLSTANAGTYYVVVTGAAGGPVTSASAVVSVNTAITAPSFTTPAALTQQPTPASATNSEGSSVTFTAEADGTGPITYEWYFNNGSGAVDTGTSGPILTLTSLSTNQAGTYYVVATGGTGLHTQSANAALTVTAPLSKTIGYLRSLMLNQTTEQPSDTTTLFSVTGVITTATNLTSGNTASYYIQDATGGINLFVTDGSDFRPQLGDLVTATGLLSSYLDNYELDVTEGAAYNVDTILSHNYPLPTPILFPWGNNPAPLSAYLATNVEGSVVMLTNLWFEAYTPGAKFVGGTAYIVTNNAGLSYTVYVTAQDTNLVVGQPIPQFAYSIAGPLVQDNTAVEIEFTVYSNLVTTAPLPPAPTLAGSITGDGSTFTITWTASTSASYSVWYSTNVAGPYTDKLATGLTFGTTAGTYTGSISNNVGNFYEVTSP